VSLLSILSRLFRHEVAYRKAWTGDLSWLVVIAYFLIFQSDPGTEQAYNSVVFILIALVGMLGMSSLLLPRNEGNGSAYTQKEKRSVIGVYGLLVFIPCFFLPLDEINLALFGSELILISIGLYTHSFESKKSIFLKLVHIFTSRLIPLSIVIWTFYLVGDKINSSIVSLGIVALAWQMLTGIRKSITRSINKELIPLHIAVLFAELLSFAGLFYIMSTGLEFAWIGLGLYVVYVLFSTVFNSKKYDSPLNWAIHYTDTFYVEWLAFFFLFGIIFIKTEVLEIFLLHLLFFRSAMGRIFNAGYVWFKQSRIQEALFGFVSFKRGLLIHLTLLVVYTALFCVAYFTLEAQGIEEDTFFMIQKKLSKCLIALILFHGILLVLLKRVYVKNNLSEFFLETSSPYNLAIFRIIIFTIILGSYYGEVFQGFEEWTHLPFSERVGLPYIGWLIEILPMSPEFYNIMSFIGLGLVISILFGFKTRWALILYVPVALYLWGVPNFFGKLNHKHIMVWIPIILAFSRCAEVLSIDALINRNVKKIPKPKASIEYAIPFKILWITLGIVYCCSGFHKLWDTGLFWALSDNLSNQIQLEWVEQYDTVSAIRIDQYPILLKIGGIGIILLEIVYPIFILKSYTRIFAFAGAWSLHLSAGYFLSIDFISLRIANLSYLNWMKGGSLLRRKSNGNVLPEAEPVVFNIKGLKRMPIIYVGGILIGMNLIFSIVQINSWPFSSYPAYSNVVPNEVKLLDMKATDSKGQLIDVKRIGKNANFGWESMRPFEERIAELVESGDTTGLQSKLESYWQLWSTKVDSLETVTKVEMRLVTTSIVPERRNEVLNSQYLGDITIKFP
jgi:hypothetical protein